MFGFSSAGVWDRGVGWETADAEGVGSGVGVLPAETGLAAGTGGMGGTGTFCAEDGSGALRDELGSPGCAAGCGMGVPAEAAALG